MNECVEEKSLAPSLAVLLSATLWGLIWYPLRLLEHAGLPGLWITAAMFTSVLTVVVVFRFSQCRFRRDQLGRLVVLMLAAGWCNVSFVLAVLHGEVARVLLLFYVSPIWTVLLGYFFLHEKISRHTLIAVTTALLGAVIMLWHPEKGLPLPAEVADWLALSSGLAFAAGNVTTRHLQSAGSSLKVAATALGVVLTVLPGIGLMKIGVPDVGVEVWSSAALLGIVFILVASFAQQYGITRLPVQYSSVILLFEIVVGAVSAWLLIGEILAPSEIVGGTLVVCAGVYAGRRHLCVA